MLLYYLFQLLPFAPVVAALAWAVWRVRSRRIWDIGLIVVSSIALAVTMLLLTRAFALTRFDYGWAAPRLAPMLSWVYAGGKLYYPSGEGPILVRLYGPVVSLVYLPVALAKRPTQALYIGAVINFVLIVGPALWLMRNCIRAEGKPVSRITLFACVAAFGLLCCLGSLLFEVLTMVSTDGPAIGFGASACAVLVRSDRRRLRDAIVCGILASLSIWAKQTMLPLVAAVLLYLLLTTNIRRSIRFGAVFLTAIAVVSATFLLLFDARAMWFDMFTIPSRQGWQWPVSTPAALWRASRIIWHDSAGIGCMLAIAIVIWFTVDRRWREHQPWLLPLLVAIFVLPTTAAAYAKLGGRGNNSAAAACFALIAAVSLFARLSADPSDQLALRSRLARATLITMMMGFIALPASRQMIASSPSEISDALIRSDTANDIVFDYCLKHPGEVYFPYYPLATLLAEHRTYHHDGGVWDLLRAGVPISDEQLHAYLPPRMRAIGLDRLPETSSMPPLLKEYSRVVAHPEELPANWILLESPNN